MRQVGTGWSGNIHNSTSLTCVCMCGYMCEYFNDEDVVGKASWWVLFKLRLESVREERVGVVEECGMVDTSELRG